MRAKTVWTIVGLGLAAGILAPAPSAEASGSCWSSSTCIEHVYYALECCSEGGVEVCIGEAVGSC